MKVNWFSSTIIIFRFYPGSHQEQVCRSVGEEGRRQEGEGRCPQGRGCRVNIWFLIPILLNSLASFFLSNT